MSYNFGGGVKLPISELFVAPWRPPPLPGHDLAPDYWRLYGGLTWWIKR